MKKKVPNCAGERRRRRSKRRGEDEWRTTRRRGKRSLERKKEYKKTGVRGGREREREGGRKIGFPTFGEAGESFNDGGFSSHSGRVTNLSLLVVLITASRGNQGERRKGRRVEERGDPGKDDDGEIDGDRYK